MSPHYFILSNSPGEISGWVKPICHYLKLAEPNCKISLLLTPCQYSSGHEKEFAKAYCKVDTVYAPNESIQFIRTSQSRPESGGIFCLGSDPIYALILRFKLKLKAVAYTHHSSLAPFIFKKIFTATEYGQLLGSSIALEKASLKTTSENSICLFMTSSRPSHFDALFPFFVETIAILNKEHPDLTCKVSISPLLPPEATRKFANEIAALDIIDPEKRFHEMAQASLMVSLVGTNTLEAAYLSLPMIALVPLNKPEIIIFDGIMGLLAKLPILKHVLPKLIIFIAKRKSGFYALPNRLLGKKVVPEVVDVIKSTVIANMIHETIENTHALNTMKDELNKIPKDQECAKQIVDEAIEIFGHGHPNQTK